MMKQFLIETWNVLLTLSPWLLIGLAASGMLYVLVPRNFVIKHLGGKGIMSVIKAVFFGVPLPLCSCGVIPAAMGIKKQGASDGASVGFLISTPQTGVDSVFVSAAFLGWPFAIFKLLSAFIIGLVGGMIVHFTDKKPAEEVKPEEKTETIPAGRKLRAMYDFSVNELLHSIWLWLVLGILVSALISTFVDANALQKFSLFKHEFGSMGIILLISLPLYVCATSSVPIAAALVGAGLPTGAALVFLMAGPASNVATMGAIYRTFGAKVLGIYLTTVALLSMILGYVFSFVLDLGVVMPEHHEHASWWSIGSAIILLGFFAMFLVKDLRRRFSQSKKVDASEELSLTVTGMTCKNCAGHVHDSLIAVEGVQAVNVDLESGKVNIMGEDLNKDALSGVIKKAGYEVDDSTSCCSI